MKNSVVQDLKMREELRKKLSTNSARLVSELDVSISFLASLLTKGVIKEEDKSAIQVSYSIVSCNLLMTVSCRPARLIVQR